MSRPARCIAPRHWIWCAASCQSTAWSPPGYPCAACPKDPSHGPLPAAPSRNPARRKCLPPPSLRRCVPAFFSAHVPVCSEYTGSALRGPPRRLAQRDAAKWAWKSRRAPSAWKTALPRIPPFGKPGRSSCAAAPFPDAARRFPPLPWRRQTAGFQPAPRRFPLSDDGRQTPDPS